jgi:hypothetical protein
MAEYPPAVAELVTLGEIRLGEEWLDYRARGIEPEHVPDLIRMLLDCGLNEGDPETPAVWAPIHALRALGQLRAAEASEAIIEALCEDVENEGDWVSEETRPVFGLIGPAALPALEATLRRRALDLHVRWVAADSIAEIGEQHPESRERCVALLVEQLRAAVEEDDDLTLKGAVVSDLVDLKAVDAAPAIERAFAEGEVDEFVIGDWEEVRYRLGLGPRPADRAGPSPWAVGGTAPRAGASPKSRAKERKHKKKVAKQSKKKNRKEKK